MAIVDKFKAEGQCRQCERPERGVGGRQLTRHRLVPGRLGGRYVMQNVVPVCRSCHDELEEQDPLARRMLRPKLWPLEIAHVIEEVGYEWFNAMYPKPAAMEIERRKADVLARRTLVAPRQMWNPDLQQISFSEKSSARTRR